jgi:sulfur relay protein TusB/DsrH
MKDNKYEIDLGFVISKSPHESTFGAGFFELAKEAFNNNKKVGIFLISDGVWFAKKNQKNKTSEILTTLIKKDASIYACSDNLEAAGIQKNELFDGIIISEEPYKDLVNLVMEKWKRVITI